MPDPELEMAGGGGGGGGVGGGHPNPEKRGAGHEYGLKISGAGSPGPSPGFATAIIRGRITMAIRTVYVEYCKLPLISLPTFKPSPPAPHLCPHLLVNK